MPVQFRIAARALRQIGAELISSDEIALNELIKNAFDAGSPQVKLFFTTPAPRHILVKLQEELKAGKVTPVKAFEVLEKELGASLNAAENLELRQRTIAYFEEHKADRAGLTAALTSFLDDAYSIRICDDGRGMSKDDLENVFLVIGTPSKVAEKASLTINDRAVLGEKGIGRLSMMRLGSRAVVKSSANGKKPWNQIKFDWTEFDDPSKFLGQIDVPVTETQKPKYSGAIGTQIRITGLSAEWSLERVNLFVNLYLRRIQNPFSKSGTKYPVEIFLNRKQVNIAGLPVWLRKSAQLTATYTYKPKLDGLQVLRREVNWENATTSEVREWSQKALADKLGISETTLVNIGEWKMNCLWFNRQKLRVRTEERSAREIADELNVWCGGIAIYRDNFRIGKTGGMEDDWLEWDGRALKTKGYTLNRYQTIGSLSISHVNNKRLIDTANREDLVSCEEVESLKRLLSEIVVLDLRTHINTIQEAEIKKAISEETTEESARESEVSLKRALANVKSMEKVLAAPEKKQLAEIKQTIQGQLEYVKTLKKSFEMAHEKRIELLELAGIGLVIEKALHELDRITERTAELIDAVEAGTEDSVGVLLARLRSQVVATNKRIRSVNALSPSGRQRKEELDVPFEIAALIETYSARAERFAVRFILNEGVPAAKGKFILRGSKGLLAQVLENLFTNSIYWLEQGLKSHETERKIWIETDDVARAVLVRDNGPGIEPKHKLDIFKPYFSERKGGKGLGLYIASEIAEYHSGKLYLNPTPDDDGRLREFILELPR